MIQLEQRQLKFRVVLRIVSRSLAIVVVFLAIPLFVRGATLYLEPSEAEYQSGDIFLVEIKIDVENECINTIKADLEFSKDILEVVDFSQGSSIITIWLNPPEINQESGLISLSGGIPSGYCGLIPGDPGPSHLLGKIVLETRQGGEGEIKFLDSSEVLLNDGLGTPAKLSAQGAFLKVLPEGAGAARNEWLGEILRDNIAPEPFEIEIHQEPSIFEGKYFITFFTADKQTGLDYFEVREGRESWQRAESPYLLKDQNLSSIIIVRAVDKAGNERTAEIRPPRPLYYFWTTILILVIAGLVWWIVRKRLLSIVFILTFFLAVGSSAQAAGSSLYLSPRTGTFFVGSIFDVSLFVNTEGNSINALEADLKFPPELLQVTSPTAGSSFISIWADQPYYSNKEGLISFKGGVPSPGINTSAGLVSVITFRAIAPGETIVSFLDSSRVLLDDGKGTNILSSSGRGVYKIDIPPPEGPELFSSTHPDQNKWYRDNNPTFGWKKEEGVKEFSYTLDESGYGRPDSVAEGDHSSVSYSDLEDGIWYFHIKAKKGNVWGGTSHYLVQIDRTPPAAFKLVFEPALNSPTTTSQEPIVSFLTTDALSGLSHYELKVIGLSAGEEGKAQFFVEVANSYRLPVLDLGEHQVVVRAYDLAGNWQDSSEKIEVISPGRIFYITKGGIDIFGLYFSWRNLAIVIALLVIFVLGLVLWMRKRHKNIFQKRRSLKEIRARAEREKEDIKKKIR